ncbi:HAD hydrolase family protein [Streptomyces longwoodensis]|uniref:HAD hydrolase family protein n=1 Tax=Streptomyces longwoodensis TaxID=68231 RepID=UPI00225441C8|nr:HAD hydrolase family protein [Streptomyces longwoodensis]MCX4994712.1 HAD hydrolase family protein [Streptomyces longwoodensis]WTI46173.1 HAD hydrolase family protein [Streptomyces longwoodensis]WUC58981.1 HAD hydrolase family protein [Streptomyces longwoodensis]WUC72484.1 HAD hydrolase family protein [Streptomyces longwoodensis]
MRENEAVTSATRQPETPASTVPPRLIATDLDGTLLRDDKTVSPRTVAALAAAEQAGIDVFFVTGRPARWMDVVSDHVHGHGLAICGNGAAVVDLHGGPGAHRFVKVRELPRQNALDAVGLLRDAAPGTVYAVEQTYGFHQEPDYPKLHMEAPDDLAPAEELLAPDGVASREPILKILAYHPTLDPDAFLTVARLSVGDRANVTRSSPSALLELSGPEVSKASTLALCCAERGISHEEVVAFGDMPNDLEMLTWAGRSYAMGNAHPDVLAAASGRTAANNEDGVALVIEQLLAEHA